MLAAPNALMITGGATTVMLAFEVLPVPPSVDVTCTLLFFTPAVVPCIFNDNVHDVLIASVPADRLTLPDPATAVAVPPQVLANPFGEATTNPAGKLSVNATPVSGMVLAAGLVMVNVSEVEPFSGIPAAPNALAIAGAATTLRLADAVLPVPPSVEVTLPVVLFLVPPVVPVTFTLKVQEVLCASVAPVRLMTFVACVAVMVPPPQLPVRPLGVETTNPAGNVSLKLIPVSVVVVLLFWIVKVSDVPGFTLRAMLAAPNALMITGGATTMMLALDVLPVPPSVEVTCTLLFFTFAVVPATFTANVHEVLMARVPADKLTVPDPATAVAVPPQVLVSPLGVATTNPAGRLSVNATPVSAMVLAAGLVMVKVSEVVPLSGRLAAPNALAIDGGATTLMLAEAVPPVPPSVEVTFPVVLFCVPAAVPVTFTAKVHNVLCARVAPVKLMTFVACVAVIVPPPQLPTRPFGVETTRPAGSVSLKPTPVRVVPVLLFWMVKVKLVEPFSGMLAAPQAL